MLYQIYINKKNKKKQYTLNNSLVLKRKRGCVKLMTVRQHKRCSGSKRLRHLMSVLAWKPRGALLCDWHSKQTQSIHNPLNIAAEPQ